MISISQNKTQTCIICNKNMEYECWCPICYEGPFCADCYDGNHFCVEDEEKPKKFSLEVRYIALGHKVLAVATTRFDGWKAYIGAVEGANHDFEFEEVLRTGAPLLEGVARSIFFGTFENIPYAR